MGVVCCSCTVSHTLFLFVFRVCIRCTVLHILLCSAVGAVISWLFCHLLVCCLSGVDDLSLHIRFFHVVIQRQADLSSVSCCCCQMSYWACCFWLSQHVATAVIHFLSLTSFHSLNGTIMLSWSVDDPLCCSPLPWHVHHGRLLALLPVILL